MTKHGSASAQDLDDKSLTICSGLDMVNINYLHVVCESAEQAKVRMRSCFDLCVSLTRCMRVRARAIVSVPF